MVKVYEVPQVEEIKVQMEESFLQASGASGEQPPIHGGDDPGDINNPVYDN